MSLQPIKMTQARAYELTTDKARERFADHKVSGLYLRVMRSGARAWTIRYRDVSGASKEMKIAEITLPIDKVRKLAVEKRAEVSMGIDPLKEKREAKAAAIDKKARTLAAVYESYKTTPKFTTKREATRNNYESRFTLHILPRIGDLPIEDIGTKEVAELLDDVYSEVSGSVSNAVKGALSVLMSYACERQLIPFNPVRDVASRHRNVIRDRVLSDNELKGLWTAINNLDGLSETVAGIIKVCLLTAARVSDVSGMEWSEVDLEARLWTVPGERMKNHKDHEVPLCDSLMAFFDNLKEAAETQWVFPNNACSGPMARDRASRACNRLCKAKGWDSFGPHDFRTTYATRMGASGLASLDIIERTLSHDVNSGKAISYYDLGGYLDQKREALEAWERELLKVVALR